jgi:hypothetical protein
MAVYFTGTSSFAPVCGRRRGHVWLGLVRLGGRFGPRIDEFRSDFKPFPALFSSAEDSCHGTSRVQRLCSSIARANVERDSRNPGIYGLASSDLGPIWVPNRRIGPLLAQPKIVAMGRLVFKEYAAVSQRTMLRGDPLLNDEQKEIDPFIKNTMGRFGFNINK